MQQLHLVGFTTDLEGLIFSARRGAKSGSFVVSLDENLVSTIAEAHRRRDGDDDAAQEVAEKIGATPAPVPRPPRPDSALNPREIQARLRAGRSIDEIAREARVESEWVERWAAPILAEQSQIVTRARALVFEKPRRGPSAEPLGRSVAWNVADKGVYLSPAQFNASWSAYQSVDRWVVRFRYPSRGREHEAAWELDGDELLALDRAASELGYLDRARRRRARPRIELADREEPPGAKPEEPAAAAAPAPTPAKRVTKRRVAKRRAPRPAAKKKTAARRIPATIAKRRRPAKRTPPKRAAANKTAGAKKATPAKRPAPAKKARARPTKARPTKARPTKRARTTTKKARRKAPAAKARPAKKKATGIRRATTVVDLAPVRRARPAATISGGSARVRREEMLAAAGSELAPRADFARSGNPAPPPKPKPAPKPRAKARPRKRPASGATSAAAERAEAAKRPLRARRGDDEAPELGAGQHRDGPRHDGESGDMPEWAPQPEPGWAPQPVIAEEAPRSRRLRLSPRGGRPRLRPRSRPDTAAEPPSDAEAPAPADLTRSRRQPVIAAQRAGDLIADESADDPDAPVRLARRRRPLRVR